MMSKAKLNSRNMQGGPKYVLNKKKVEFRVEHSLSPSPNKLSSNDYSYSNGDSALTRDDKTSKISRPSLFDNTTFRDRSAFGDDYYEDSSMASMHAAPPDLGSAFKNRQPRHQIETQLANRPAL